VPATTKAEAARPADVKLEVVITESKTVYTLRRAHELPPNSSIGDYLAGKDTRAPLSLEDARAGTNGVQLVTEETAAAGQKPKAESKAYQIAGSITPPKADAPAAGGTDPSKGTVLQ
jgi:hypothetical protein